MEGSALLYVTTLPGFVATGIVVVEKKYCDHVFKGCVT